MSTGTTGGWHFNANGSAPKASMSNGNEERDDAELRRILEDCLEAVDSGEPLRVLERCGGRLDLAERIRDLLGYEPLASALLGIEEKEADPLLGRRSIASYKLIRLLGSGGMGMVYLARDEALQRELAVKVLLPGRGEPLRFRREAAIAAALVHPNIVPIYGIGEDEGIVFFAMKRLSGPAWNALPAPLDAKTAARNGAKLARAIHFAHESGVLHRDIKPANIIFDAEEPVLVDFGLARNILDATLTEEGRLLGTLAYLAPERLRSSQGHADPAADVYALGATLYEVVSGRPCYDHSDRERLIREILLADPKPLGLPRPERDVETVILRAISKEPQRRFATALELAEELERCARGDPITSRPGSLIGNQWRKLRRRPRAAAGLVVLLLLTSAIAGISYNSILKQRVAQESAVGDIENLIAASDFTAALESAARHSEAHPENREIAQLRAKSEALVLLEGALDAAFGIDELKLGPAGEPIQVSRVEILKRVFEPSNAGVFEEGKDRLLRQQASIALALSSLRLEDARRLLEESQRSVPASRGLQALRGAVSNPPSWIPPMTPAVSAFENLTTVFAMRYCAAPIEEQEAEINRVLQSLEPDAPKRSVAFALAAIRCEQGQGMAALDILKLTAPRVRQSASYLRRLAHVLINVQQFEEARATLEQIPRSARLGVDHARLVILSMTQGDQGATDAALRAAQEEGFGQDTAFLLVAAQAALWRNDYAAARPRLERILELPLRRPIQEFARANLAVADLQVAMAESQRGNGAEEIAAKLAKIDADLKKAEFVTKDARALAAFVRSSIAMARNRGDEAVQLAIESLESGASNPITLAHAEAVISELTQGGDVAMPPEQRTLATLARDSITRLLGQTSQRQILPPNTRFRMIVSAAVIEAYLNNPSEANRWFNEAKDLIDDDLEGMDPNARQNLRVLRSLIDGVAPLR